MKPLQPRSPKKETKKRTFISYLSIHFICIRETKEHRRKEGKAEAKSY